MWDGLRGKARLTRRELVLEQRGVARLTIKLELKVVERKWRGVEERMFRRLRGVARLTNDGRLRLRERTSYAGFRSSGTGK